MAIYYKLTVAVFLFSLLLALPTKTNAQHSWKWAVGSDAPDSSFYDQMASAIDKAGNVIMGGEYFGKGTMKIGSTTTYFPDSANYIFITKTDSSKNTNWALGIKGSNNIQSIVCDDTGNVYVCGIYEDTLYLGAHSLTTTIPYFSRYLFKLSPMGIVLWAKNLPGDGAQFMGIDRANKLYLCGYFSDSMSVTGTTVYGPANSIFIEKCDAGGSPVWLKSIAHDSIIVRSQTMTVSETGMIYLIARFKGFVADTTLWKLPVGGTMLSWLSGIGDSTNRCAFLTKIDSSGHFRWAHYVNSDIQYANMTTDKNDNLYTTGYFTGYTSIGGMTVGSHGMSDLTVAKFDSAGTLKWANYAGGDYNDRGADIAVDNCGTIWTGGEIGTNGGIPPDTSYYMNFNGNLLQAPDSASDPLFIARYDSSGNYLFGLTLRSGSDDWFAMLPDRFGNLYVGGDVANNTMRFGTDIVTASEFTERYFLARYVYDSAGCDISEAIKEVSTFKAISIYPNPANELVEIEYEGEIKSVAIANMYGQTLYYGVFNGWHASVVVSSLPPGLYIIKINDNVSKKMVKW